MYTPRRHTTPDPNRPHCSSSSSSSSSSSAKRSRNIDKTFLLTFVIIILTSFIALGNCELELKRRHSTSNSLNTQSKTFVKPQLQSQSQSQSPPHTIFKQTTLGAKKAEPTSMPVAYKRRRRFARSVYTIDSDDYSSHLLGTGSDILPYNEEGTINSQQQEQRQHQLLEEQQHQHQQQQQYPYGFGTTYDLGLGLGVGLGLGIPYPPQQFYDTHLPIAGAGVINDLASLNLVTGARKDLCKECTCARIKNAFLTVTCDFQKNRQLNPKFGSDYKVPRDVTSITIRLAPRINFQLQRDFFSDNQVNSITLEGTNDEHEQVEITTEAFRGNNGPYPEVIINNVFTVIVRERAFSAGSAKFTVRNSNELILFSNAFVNAEINGLFMNIRDLRIEEKAFDSARAKLRIESSHIDNIYRFEASLREIRFVNCSIGTINGGTFDVNNINSIVFENCRIDVIKARAITEKLYSKHVAITGAIIGSIESEAIYGSGISELILSRNKIETIAENAIHVTAINATITRNNIKHLGNNWLRVQEWSNIIIDDNQFGVFGRMSLEDTKVPGICRFNGNSLTKPLPGSLDIKNVRCMLHEISVNIPCRCNLNWLQELSTHDLRSETYCTIDDKLGYCFNATTFNTLKYLNEVCDESKTTLDCVANMNLKKIDGHFFTPEELEQRDQRLPQMIFIIGGSSLLLLLSIVLLFVTYRFCSHSYKQEGGNTNDHCGNLNAATHSSEHCHDFSLEERHIIEQTLQLTQKKYPEIYKEVNERTQQLLQRELPDKKCVKVVTQLVNLLSKVQHAGGDFDAFNRVLAQHLQPQIPTAPPSDPIYTEPGLDDGGGFYTSSTIVALPTQGYDGPHHHLARSDSMQGTQPSEHIYAEPNCAQQPLLRNEYASPADRNVDTVELYTEPVNERDGELPPAAYSVSNNISTRLPQYSMPTRNQHQRLPSIPSNLPFSTTASTAAAAALPRTQQPNLPDVIYQGYGHTNYSPTTPGMGSKPMTNVQKLAQNLQSMPKFQLNQLNRPQHLHLVTPPVYTAPDVSHKQQQKRARGTEARLASPENVDEFDLDMRGATALPIITDSGSHHSGGSSETVEADDIVQYADA